MSNSGANFESLTKGQGLSLKTFGAKWDGVTDDSAALKKAVEWSVENNGSPILLPENTGVINSTIKLPKNIGFQIPVAGAGIYSTTVKMPENLQLFGFVNTVAGDTVGNVSLSGFTIDGNNQQVSENHSVPVVIGTNVGYNEQVNIENIFLRRVRTKNIPILDKQENGRRNVFLGVFHNEPGLAMNIINNIDIRECELEGGQGGVFIEGIKGSGPLPLNVKIGRIYIKDLQAKLPTAPTTKQGNNACVIVGGKAWSDGRDIKIDGVVGENSGDVGVEMDVPGIIRNCTMRNCNNTGFLFNTFNCATLSEPIVAKITEKITVGATKAKVASTEKFTVGENIVVFGTTVALSEVRTLKAKTETELEFTESFGNEHDVSSWLQQVDNMNAVKFKAENLKSERTETFLGNNSCIVFQNLENALPMPEVDINGLSLLCTAKDITTGTLIKAQCGSANSPTGNPAALRIRGLKAEHKGFENTTAENKAYWPIFMQMRGPTCPIEIQGEINVEGPGATGGGKIIGQLIHMSNTSGILDLDLITKWTVKNIGGESMRAICLNQESTGGPGDLTGRIRHRARKSTITEGGGTVLGIRLGKACAFASQTVKTTLNTAELAKESLTVPVKSTEGFSVGQAIVLDALSTTKSEIVVIKEIEAGVSLKLVEVGATPGTKEVHTEGAVIAPLKSLLIEDCDWFGLGSGAGVQAEDENIFMRTTSRGNVWPTPPISTAISFPGSAKAFQIIQKGQSGIVAVESGTVSAIEWSSNGKSYVKYAAATGAILPVSSGDYIKVTDSVEPTITFQADRR